MKYYDRYKGEMVNKLPIRMDLGRFAIVDNGIVRDLTNEDVAKEGDYVIRESLFEATNQNIHDLLYTIAESFKNNPKRVIPIIQKFNSEIKEFEKLLNTHKSHLKAIAANPHSLLDKNTMKVNIGRAKRISTRSYQYLAHHSEDWEKMSVLSPKPRKILNDELIIDYAVYENLLLKTFLHEAIKQLNTRIKETADISKFFLSIFETKWICNNCHNVFYGADHPAICPYCKDDKNWSEEKKIWPEKINRRNKLVGKAAKLDQSKTSSDTNTILAGLRAELVKIEHTAWFEELPKHSVNSFVFHDTNVLNSHKHYKYLKILWLELKKLKEQRDDHQDPIIVHQNVMNNLRIYVKSLYVYTLLQMKYELTTSQEGVVYANHPHLPQIELKSDSYGVLHLSTVSSSVRIIVLGGISDITHTKELPDGTICFCFSDYQRNTENSKGIYFVNPIDTDSIECSGQIIRSLILSDYKAVLCQKTEFKHSLRDFLSVIDDDGISFDKESFTFSFSKKFPKEIEEERIISKLKLDQKFNKRNKRDKDSIIHDMSELIAKINEVRQKIMKTLVCPKCHTPYRLSDINYLTCKQCGFIFDISHEHFRFFHTEKERSYPNITKKGWGMDFIEESSNEVRIKYPI